MLLPEPVTELTLLALATAVMGWFYSRRHGVAEAQKAAAAAWKETADAAQRETQQRERERDLAVQSKEDCEKELVATKDALALWDQVLGDIWITEYGLEARPQPHPPAEPDK